jgi:hypothetical protein
MWVDEEKGGEGRGREGKGGEGRGEWEGPASAAVIHLS